jgi:hypothetical protein
MSAKAHYRQAVMAGSCCGSNFKMAGARSDDAIELGDTEVPIDGSIKQTCPDNKGSTTPGTPYANRSVYCAAEKNTEGCSDGCCESGDGGPVPEAQPSLQGEAGTMSEGCCADGEACDGEPARTLHGEFSNVGQRSALQSPRLSSASLHARSRPRLVGAAFKGTLLNLWI